MKRTLVAIGVAAVAVGILAFMAVESSPIPASVHIAQNSLSNELDTVAEDYRAIDSALQSAWQNQSIPGDAVRALIQRNQTSPERLRLAVQAISGNEGQRNRIDNSFQTFEQTMSTANELTRVLVDDITAFGASVSVIRETGPDTVQNLRDLRLDRAATDTFELVAGAVDFAETGNQNQGENLRRMLTMLERDQRIDANMPREMATLRTAVTTLLDSYTAIQSRLDQYSSSSIITAAGSLNNAVRETYQQSVARINRARILLAAYAMLLLASVGIIGYRLKDSYAEVAEANANLSALNDSLEQRVETRTKELEGTLADLKESQVQLVQAEKMSSLGQLVAGISHEINTPLLYLANNVVLIGERLQQLTAFVQRSIAAYGMRPEDFETRTDYQKAFAGALNELKTTLDTNELDADLSEAQDLLEDCVDGLKDLTEMAQSLKDFSRLDRAPVGNFNVNTGLDKTLVIAKNMIKHRAQITKHYSEVPDIECSPSKINQVFLNLISNAAQAIEDSGEIVLLTERRGEHHVAVSISDTGCGIPGEIIDKIRDPFFTTKAVGTGTGLGLSIVDEIIRSHGGELLIQSEVGKGSKFTVVLPIKSDYASDEPTDDNMTMPSPDDAAAITPLAEAV